MPKVHISGSTKNGHGLLHASLVEPPLDYLASHLNTDVFLDSTVNVKEILLEYIAVRR